jgi:hypothetical protein
VGARLHDVLLLSKDDLTTTCLAVYALADWKVEGPH